MNPCIVSALVPLWIGIVANIALAAFNVVCIGRRPGPFMTWYFDRNGGPKIMISMWILIIAAAIFSGMNGCR
jgi:hypothetical protein